MTTVVHLLRHGEVENPAKVLYGRLPGYRLSELGRRMAETVAESLAGRDITHLVASPLERAVETAEPSAKRLDLATQIDPELIESDNRFEGLRMTGKGGALRQPGNWWLLRNPVRPSWGEPYRQVALRMERALHRARAAAEGHEALCVSHQLPIWILRLHLEGRRLWHDPRTRQCNLASLTSFHFEGERLTQITYAEPAAHLGPGVGLGA